MGIIAEWCFWVGLSELDYDLFEMPEGAKTFIEMVMEPWAEPVNRDDLEIVSIGMHGETIGFGVIIYELSWETDIKTSNVFDPVMVAHAQEVQITLNKIFDQVGIAQRAALYHHINLGG